jgi:hypothetical protein
VCMLLEYAHYKHKENNMDNELLFYICVIILFLL